jgi:hypothetical protein
MASIAHHHPSGSIKKSRDDIQGWAPIKQWSVNPTSSRLANTRSGSLDSYKNRSKVPLLVYTNLSSRLRSFVIASAFAIGGEQAFGGAPQPRTIEPAELSSWSSSNGLLVV